MKKPKRSSVLKKNKSLVNKLFTNIIVEEGGYYMLPNRSRLWGGGNCLHSTISIHGGGKGGRNEDVEYNDRSTSMYGVKIAHAPSHM